MNRLDAFEREQGHVRRFDSQGLLPNTAQMCALYQRRNTFGLDLGTTIHRIFQKEFLEKDMSEGFLTLPRASASIWNDRLENPLASVVDADPVTGSTIHLGHLVSSFHALCWTQHAKAQGSDWTSFSHGKKAVRISTTAGKLMDRIMSAADPSYMHRAWLIEVDYKDPVLIQAMKTPGEVYKRMESQGALLALSSAVVRSTFTTEDEVRLLFDTAIQPALPGLVTVARPALVKIPFKWDDFVDNLEAAPA